MLCLANIPTMESTVPGEITSFMVNEVEEFSTISITVTARNNGGEESATITITTSSAGTYMPQPGFHLVGGRGWGT